MATETAETTSTAEPLSPFAAALDKAFSAQPEPAAEATEKAAEQPAKPTAPKETKAAPAKVEEKKSDIPKELFKKPDASKADEPKSSVDAIAEPTFKDDKGKAGWEALKKEAKTWEQKALEIERRIAEQKAAGKDTETLEARLAEKEKQLGEYSELVAQANLELTPGWKRDIIEPTNKELGRAKALAEEVDGDAEALMAAVQLQGKARATALRELGLELDGVQSGRLGRIIEKLDEIRERADSERATAKQSLAERQEQERQRVAQDREQFSKESTAAFEKAVRKLRAENPFLQTLDGNEKWSSRAEAIINEARDGFTHETLDQAAEDRIMARAARPALEMIGELLAETESVKAKNKELEDELKGIHGKSPSLVPRGSSASGEPSKRPFMSAFDRATGGE